MEWFWDPKQSREIETFDGDLISKCEVCGEQLRGEIAEVVKIGDAGKPGFDSHLIVHESCYDRDTMLLA